jgi:multiple sugar transport system substrate-binding protein
MKNLLLRGITWNHSRALPPLVAAAQRFEEHHPNVRILWEKRSLHEFGHTSLAELAHAFDLIVVDHPMMGEAEDVLVNLRPMLSSADWDNLEADSTGKSFDSYIYEDALYALPIDAAAPAASCRMDLLEAVGLQVPTNWGELLDLARRKLARMPGFPADLFLNFMGMCVSRGSPVAAGDRELFDRTIALQCLEELRELASTMPSVIYDWNPIALYEQMASTDEFAYCPFAYSYNNYSRAGFAARPLRFSLPVSLPCGAVMQTVLGGTGLAISTSCRAPELALDYSLYVAGTTCQSTLYGLSGGQPARRSAWQNPVLNQLTDGFFERTLPGIETAYVRPRYRGYIALQEQAGIPIVQYLRDGGLAVHALDKINCLFRNSLTRKVQHA